MEKKRIRSEISKNENKLSINCTTVHGVNHILNSKHLLIERLLWSVLVSLGVYGLFVTGLSNIKRFRQNPTVISIEKDYRNWYNPFPAMTGCFTDRLDETLAENLITDFGFLWSFDFNIINNNRHFLRIWNINYTHPKYEYYWKFVESIANINYHSLGNLERFQNDTELNQIDIFDIAAKVQPQFQGKLATSYSWKAQWQLTMSELGFCYTLNSKFSNFLRVKAQQQAVNGDNPRYELFKCHILNGLCYARFDSDPSRFVEYYVHSYLDIPHISMNTPILLDESGEIEINYKMQQTTADSSTRRFTPTQRGCRFDNEPLDKVMPAYSSSLCYTYCRYRKALELCGCKPLFYHYLEGRKCDIKGLLCLSKQDFWKKPPTAIGCRCPQPCDIIAYIPQVPKKTVWKTGYFDQRITFRWGLVFPTTKYIREIIFDVDNLVASIGGTGGLFLGVSFVTLLELIVLLCKLVASLINKLRRILNPKL